MVVRPNVFLNLLPDHVIVHTLPAARARPLARDVRLALRSPTVVARPGFDPADTVAVFDRVNRQDWEVCELGPGRASARGPSRAGGVYVPIERHIRGFNDFVLAQLGVTAADPDPGPV